MKLKYILVPVIILVSGFLSMKFLLASKPEVTRKSPVIQPKIVQAMTVSPGDVETIITSYGRVTSTNPVILFSEVSGTIERGSVPFLPGQSFRKGDLLYKVDDRQINLDIKSAKSDFMNSLATVLPEIKIDFPEEFTVFQDYFKRTRFDKSLPDLPEINNQKIKILLARFNVYKFYFTIKDLEIRLAKHFYYAPFSGSVLSTDLRVGSTVRVGSRLGELISMENLEIEVPVQVHDLPLIDTSSPVKLSSESGTISWSGKVSRIGRIIETKSQTVPVYLTISGDSDQLFQGLYLQTRFPGKTLSGTVSIPRQAIYDDSYVYLVVDDKLEKREVSLSRKEEDRVLISSGLTDGDVLVTEILQGVTAGTAVTVSDNGAV